MNVPRYFPNKGWVVETYDDSGKLLNTKQPTLQESNWFKLNPVEAQAMTAEFDIVKQRHLKEDPTVQKALKNIRDLYL